MTEICDKDDCERTSYFKIRVPGHSEIKSCRDCYNGFRSVNPGAIRKLYNSDNFEIIDVVNRILSYYGVLN